MISQALSQVQRTSEVIRHIRTMAGREPTDRAFEDVSAVVEEAAGLALIGAEAKGVSAHMELAEGLPPALINRTQEIGRAHAELQSLMRISYAVFCLKKKTKQNRQKDAWHTR